jgi:hypothetical protein
MKTIVSLDLTDQGQPHLKFFCPLCDRLVAEWGACDIPREWGEAIIVYYGSHFFLEHFRLGESDEK